MYDAVDKLQDRLDMVINSFAACSITDGSRSTAALVESQLCPDTDDEIDADNPFTDELETFDYEL